MGWWNNFLGKRENDDSNAWDALWEDLFNTGKRDMAKYGMSVVANYVARSFLDIEVDAEKKDTTKRLNLNPNVNQNGPEFWRDVVYKLITDNEVLVIANETKDLLIADDFEVTDYANYENVYSGVTVGEFTFQRSFLESDVIHMRFSTDEWQDNFTRMNKEMDKLYDYVITNETLRNQFRATIGIDANGGLSGKSANSATISDYLEKVRNSIEHNKIALMPELNGLKFDEKSGQYSSANGVDVLTRIKNMVVADAANLVGVPVALLTGEQADTSGSLEVAKQNVLTPLLQLLEKECSKKLQENLLFRFANDRTVITDAERIDKLISSGFRTVNQVGKLYKYPPVEGGDERIMTKNYESVSTNTEGGD